MQLHNSTQKYGLIIKLVHWFSALMIIGLYIMGKWMEDLDYYSEWYQTAPYWHKSIGIILLGITIYRLYLKFTSVAPQAIITLTQQRMASITHYLIYLCLFITMFSGYLLAATDGNDIAVFNWFVIPSVGQLINHQEDIAGEIHELASNAVILLVIIHVAGALKHHFIDKDKTLSRMIN